MVRVVSAVFHRYRLPIFLASMVIDEVPGHIETSGPKFTMGVGNRVTLVVLEPVQPLLSVTVTVYVPICAESATESVGVKAVELKPAGPLQLYV